MRRLRIISQWFFFIAFIVVFMGLSYPLNPAIPTDAFFRMSPLIALGTIIATREFYSYFGLAFAILALALLFGRLFCGWICPFGSLLDGLSFFIKKRSNNRLRNLRHLKYMILVAMLLAAFISFQFIWLLDPISMITRSFSIVVFPLFNYLLTGTISVSGNYDSLSDTAYYMQDKLLLVRFLFKPVSFRFGVATALIFIAILFLEKISRRFYCRNLCPLGALLGFFSRFRLLHHDVLSKCNQCEECQPMCKMDAILDETFSSSPMECINCFACIGKCPRRTRKISFGFITQPSGVNFSRRGFILAAGAGIVTTGLVKGAYGDESRNELLVRPPGALPEKQFLNRCIRCEACVKICSSTGEGLQPAILEAGWEGLWSPILVARKGYCEYTCNLCGKICPTNAIRELQLPEKKNWIIGRAFFDKNRCIPFYKNENCIVCEEHCPVPEKAIKFNEIHIHTPDGEPYLLKQPYVIENRCIGCGICVTKCPVAGLPGIFITSAGETRTGSLPEESYSYP